MTAALSRDASVFVAGHAGLAGSAIVRRLTASGFSDVRGLRSSELDLRDRDAVETYIADTAPTAVVLAAARVGGIAANAKFPIDYLSDNLRIQLNVMDAARAHDVARLVFIGSSAAYPADAVSPIHESVLMTGPPTSAHAGYALAKQAGMQYVRDMRASGAGWSALIPTNIYGRHDNFHSEWSHVVPALLRKFNDAVAQDLPEVNVWGTGRAYREFLHADDLASAVELLLDQPPADGPGGFNVGSGEEVTIAHLAELVASVVGYQGTITFDAGRPDGVARRVLECTALRELGWAPETFLSTGLRDTFDWFVESWPDVRH